MEGAWKGDCPHCHGKVRIEVRQLPDGTKGCWVTRYERSHRARDHSRSPRRRSPPPSLDISGLDLSGLGASGSGVMGAEGLGGVGAHDFVEHAGTDDQQGMQDLIPLLPEAETNMGRTVDLSGFGAHMDDPIFPQLVGSNSSSSNQTPRRADQEVRVRSSGVQLTPTEEEEMPVETLLDTP